jgi:putative oxidoreductase
LKIASFIVRFVLAAGLIYSGVTKVLAPFEFLNAILRYELLGSVGSTLVAAVLPWLEIVSGVALLHRPAVRAAGWIAIAMGVAFVLAQLSALVRGLEIACGCVGGSASEPIGAFSLLRAFAVALLGTAVVVLSQAADAQRIAAKSPGSCEDPVAG